MNTGKREAIKLVSRHRSSRISASIKRRTNDCPPEGTCDNNARAGKRLKYIKTCPPGDEGPCVDTSVGQMEVGGVKQEILTNESRVPYQPDGYINVDNDELDLERTLLGGQSFRWTKQERADTEPRKIFSGIVGELALSLWRCDEAKIGFKILSDNIEREKHSLNNVKTHLENYFQLKYKVKDLYKDWSARDKNLEKCCEDYKGFRILRQDPTENVFSFICATNNNIKRISQMVENMCKHFGERIGTIGSFHKFPTIERLACDDVEDCLRNKLSFGYRAKYICGTAKKLIELSRDSPDNKSPSDILLSFRESPYQETCKQLQQLPGIGRKVADCICLMSMDHLNAVPTDCHIYEIVCRNYIPALSQRKGNLNEQVHNQIGEYFNSLHGPLAGWATSVLFIAELKHLKMNKDEKVGKGVKKRQSIPAK